jgi:hypothetical protein
VWNFTISKPPQYNYDLSHPGKLDLCGGAARRRRWQGCAAAGAEVPLALNQL